MYRKKLSTLRNRTNISLQGLANGYMLHRWGKTREDFKGDPEEATKLFYEDEYLYWLSDLGHATEHGDPVVIDFSDDLEKLNEHLSNEDDYIKFGAAVLDDFMQCEKMHLPFSDNMIYCGNIMVNMTGLMTDCVVRVRDISHSWNPDDIKKRKLTAVWEISLFSGSEAVVNGQGLADYEIEVGRPMGNQHGSYKGQQFQAPSCAPIVVFFNRDGMVTWRQIEWNEVTEAIFYPDASRAEIDRYAKAVSTIKMFIVASFVFMYRNQKVEYRDIEPPSGLQKKHLKKNDKPLERYYVSRLGDYTSTRYSESGPREKSEDVEHGVALHVRKGHWRLKWGHRKLPKDKQEKVWIDSTVVGDPTYGIIMRDYETDLAQHIEEDLTDVEANTG